MWYFEHITDEHDVFKRAHKNWFRGSGNTYNFSSPPGLGCFNNLLGGSSCDWEQYSTPQQTRERMGKPLENAVMALAVGAVRALPASG